MRRLLAALAGALALASCNQGVDGYTFGEPTWVATDLDVKIVLVPSLEEMEKLRAERGVPAERGASGAAFSLVSSTGRCTIYKVDSRADYRPDLDGHELNHCIYGDWHGK